MSSDPFITATDGRTRAQARIIAPVQRDLRLAGWVSALAGALWPLQAATGAWAVAGWASGAPLMEHMGPQRRSGRDENRKMDWRRRRLARRASKNQLCTPRDQDMKPIIPQKFEHIAFGFLLSCFMSLLISGVATFLATGLVPGFGSIWLSSWLSAWAIAFPSVLVVAPFVRRVLRRIVIVDVD